MKIGFIGLGMMGAVCRPICARPATIWSCIT